MAVRFNSIASVGIGIVHEPIEVAWATSNLTRTVRNVGVFEVFILLWPEALLRDPGRSVAPPDEAMREGKSQRQDACRSAPGDDSIDGTAVDISEVQVAILALTEG